MLLPAATAHAATFNVTTDNDSSAGACLPASCTLRQAVAAVNAGAGGDTINVPPGLYTLTFGELQLQKDVSIVGAGPSTTVVEGSDLSRVFNVSGPGVVASISGLAVENGRVAGTGASQAHGGGILNAGTLTLRDALVRGNAVVPADGTGLIPEGGGIFNSGTLHVFDTTIAGNRANTLPEGGIPTGGGLVNQGGKVDLTDSVLAGNVASGKGGIPQAGGLYSAAASAHGAGVTLTRVLVEGNRTINTDSGGIPEAGGIYAFRTDLTIVDSTVSGNKAVGGAIAEAGGIFVLREGNFTLERSLVANNVAESGTFTDGAGLAVNGETTEVQKIVNSTITGNRGTSPSGNNGAGIFHFGGAPLDVLSSTISGNIASGSGASDQGGNLWDSGGSGSVLSVRDSIVSGGGGTSGFENCFGSGVQSAGHNIDSLDQCNFNAAGDKVNTNPLLAALAENGGPTETLALAAGSPAIDAGDAACPATDQRGVARPQGSACDIGAFELVPTPPPPPSPGGVAKLEFLARKVTINLKTGKGTMLAKCLNVSTDKCAVALSLLAPKASRSAGQSRRLLAKRAVSIGTAAGTIAGGKTGKLKFKVKRKGLAMLRAKKGHKLKVTAVGQSKNNAGQAVAIRQKLTLKGKAAKKKK